MVLPEDKENMFLIMMQPHLYGYDGCKGCNRHGATYDDHEVVVNICNVCGGDGVMPNKDKIKEVKSG